MREIGKCIYCGAGEKGEELTKEHIIALGLGGTEILRKASCKPCEVITGRIEMRCMDAMLSLMRLIYRFPSRGKRPKPSELPISVIDKNGEKQTVMLPIDDFPAFHIGFPSFGLPSRMTNPDDPGHFQMKPCYVGVPDMEARMARLRERIGAGREYQIGFEILPMPFLQMIAKIAHCSAVARFGLDSFVPLLPSAILAPAGSTASVVANVVGTTTGDLPDLRPKGVRGLHYVGWGLVDTFHKLEPFPPVKTTYVAGFVHLFSALEAPIYIALVGLPTPALEQYLAKEVIHDILVGDLSSRS